MKILFALLSFFSLLVTVDASAQPISAKEIEDIYTKYLAVGRSDTEIQFSLYGSAGAARISTYIAGGYNCRISGLGIDPKEEHQKHPYEQIGRVIHEATHCLVSPYLNIGERKGSGGAIVAHDLEKLFSESVSDARGLIEIFRHDGLPAAEAYAAFMVPYRKEAGKDVAHLTFLSLQEALRIVRETPETVSGNDDAFRSALEIGRKETAETARQLLKESGHLDLLDTPEAKAAVIDIDKAIARAETAFANGKFANDAITIRKRYEGSSPDDYHFYVASGERISTVGTEGSHGRAALVRVIAPNGDPEHDLAVDILNAYRDLGPDELTVMESVVKRFLDGHNEKQQKEVIAIIREEIADPAREYGLDDLYNRINRRIMFEVDPKK